jgi:hypothetical protein
MMNEAQNGTRNEVEVVFAAAVEMSRAAVADWNARRRTFRDNGRYVYRFADLWGSEPGREFSTFAAAARFAREYAENSGCASTATASYHGDVLARVEFPGRPEVAERLAALCS